MRITLKNLADARKELFEIQQEFVHFQTRLDAIQNCITESLTRFFGEERPAIAALAEEEFIVKLADRVVSQLGIAPRSQVKSEQRYVRDVEAAKYLGVSPATLRSWRSKRLTSGLPVTRMGNMVMYSMKGLAQYMEERTRAHG
jgi:hypothetical protein